MDETRLTELGVTPVKPEFDRIAATDGRKGLAETLARPATVTNDTVFLAPVVSTDNNDRTRYAVFMVDADPRRDDYFGNVVRLNEFKMRRDVARFGKPVREDTFAIPTSTLPTVINAAYQPPSNSIEIPAAFLQPPCWS